MLVMLLFLVLAWPLAAMADITTGLVAYWTFNTDGADASGNGHTGTLSGTPVFLSGASCKVGGCLVCDGVNDRVAYTTITTGTTFTITFWVYNQVTAAYGTILADAAAGNGAFILDNKVTLFYSGADHLSTTVFPAATWTHIGIVVNAGAVQFYLNGATDGTASGAPGFAAETTCDSVNLDVHMIGRIDELRLYSRALSQADVQQAMNFTGGGAPPLALRRPPIIY
jgi:hypothetical protein